MGYLPLGFGGAPNGWCGERGRPATARLAVATDDISRAAVVCPPLCSAQNPSRSTPRHALEGLLPPPTGITTQLLNLSWSAVQATSQPATWCRSAVLAWDGTAQPWSGVGGLSVPGQWRPARGARGQAGGVCGETQTPPKPENPTFCPAGTLPWGHAPTQERPPPCTLRVCQPVPLSGLTTWENLLHLARRLAAWEGQEGPGGRVGDGPSADNALPWRLGLHHQPPSFQTAVEAPVTQCKDFIQLGGEQRVAVGLRRDARSSPSPR